MGHAHSPLNALQNFAVISDSIQVDMQKLNRMKKYVLFGTVAAAFLSAGPSARSEEEGSTVTATCDRDFALFEPNFATGGGLPAVIPPRAIDFSLARELASAADSRVMEQMIQDLVVDTPILLPVGANHVVDNHLLLFPNVVDPSTLLGNGLTVKLASGQEMTAQHAFDSACFDQVSWQDRVSLAEKLVDRILNEGAGQSPHEVNDSPVEGGRFMKMRYPKVDLEMLKLYAPATDSRYEKAMQWLNKARTESEAKNQIVTIVAAGLQDWALWYSRYRNQVSKNFYTDPLSVKNVLDRHRPELGQALQKRLREQGLLLNRDIPAQQYWPKWKRAATLFNQELNDARLDGNSLRASISRDEVPTHSNQDLPERLSEANRINSLRLTNVSKMLSEIAKSELPDGSRFADTFPNSGAEKNRKSWFSGLRFGRSKKPGKGSMSADDFQELQTMSRVQKEQLAHIKTEVGYLQNDIAAENQAFDRLLGFARQPASEIHGRLESLRVQKTTIVQQMAVLQLMNDQIETANSHLRSVSTLIAMHGGVVPPDEELKIIEDELRAYAQALKRFSN